MVRDQATTEVGGCTSSGESLRRILLVDDEPALLRGLCRLLQGEFELRVADSGPTALKLMEDGERFPVVVSDLRMPGMNGFDFIEHASIQSPDSVFLMLTADVQVDRGDRTMPSLFRLLFKPASASVMRSHVEDAFREYESRLEDQRPTFTI